MSRQESATEEGEGGPGLVYMPFVVMEDLLDKLKLLHYEQVLLNYFLGTFKVLLRYFLGTFKVLLRYF